MKRILCVLLVVAAFGCTAKKSMEDVVISLKEEYSENARGIEQCAALWTEADGDAAAFETFVRENLVLDSTARKTLFEKLSYYYERFYGTADQLSVELLKPTTLTGYDPIDVDYLMGSYSTMAHFSDDMFASKAAFLTVLNFPYYTLAEKNELGASWSRLQWAYARMGDIFTSRVPADVNQKVNQALADAENYIASYNIMMGHLLTDDGRKIFPADMCLLSHWNLRDELKSNYADVPNASEKQEMIYRVMERIVCQEIPSGVVNNTEYDWNPFSNDVWKDGEKVTLSRENDTRYQRILDIFHAYQLLDPYFPSQPTAIQRNFDAGMEVSDKEIEDLFVKLISSEEVKKVASIIKDRLGRDLRPYDIWYDGFKSRSVLPEDQLTAKTRALYPDAAAFGKDMPRLLQNLGFTSEKAEEISGHVVVEPAIGSGHAWPCVGRWQPARLRTRIGVQGMDYKGYNIAVHEFGHNVEGVLSLYGIDYYTMAGIPNTGFTEAMAFLFQNRDLQLLGYGKHETDKNFMLDTFWGMYEIMGVSLVDMYVWRWLYENPNADAAALREEVVSASKDVWNRYYEPVLGTHDSPILAIYSHMVNAPMYLPNYPYGHIVHFQLEQHLASFANPQDFAAEVSRIYRLGRLTPTQWMLQAVGSPVSVDAVLESIRQILD